MTTTDLTNKLMNNRFFQKDGFFSKTAAILIVTWVFVLFKFLFENCILTFTIPFVGVYVYWLILFDWANAGAITASASALYFAVHNLRKDVNVTDAPPLAAVMAPVAPVAPVLPTQVDVNIKEGK